MPDLVTGTLAVVGGASVYSGRRSAKAAEEAAKAQQKGIDQGIEEQRRQFDLVQKILAPYVSAGRPDLTQPYIGAGPGAVQQMQRLVGLGGEQARQQALFDVYQGTEFRQLSDITDKNIEEYERKRKQELELFKRSADYRRPVLAKGESRANKQKDLLAQFDMATDKGIRDIETQGYNQQQALLKPIREGQQYDEIGRQQQQQAIQQIEQGPLFQELARQGEAALLANASATGRRGAEDTQSALARYRPQLLNQLIDQTYARLGGLTNVGQTAAQSLLNIGQASAAGTGAAATAAGNAISGLYSDRGAAGAAGIIGAANAQNQGLMGAVGALGDYTSTFGAQNFMREMRGMPQQKMFGMF